MYIIKQYKNRKLYDTQRSQYVNLKDIEFLVKTVNDVSVIDHEGKDITGKTMLAIIANKKENEVDTSTLEAIIKKGNGLLTNTSIKVVEKFSVEYVDTMR